jgi:hypothetical protein
MSLNALLTCSDSSWTSPGVVWSLPLLAPCLAPRMTLASLRFLPKERHRLFQSAILLVAA